MTKRFLTPSRTPLIKRSYSSQRIASYGGGLRPWEPTWSGPGGSLRSSSSELAAQYGGTASARTPPTARSPKSGRIPVVQRQTVLVLSATGRGAATPSAGQSGQPCEEI